MINISYILPITAIKSGPRRGFQNGLKNQSIVISKSLTHCLRTGMIVLKFCFCWDQLDFKTAAKPRPLTSREKLNLDFNLIFSRISEINKISETS